MGDVLVDDPETVVPDRQNEGVAKLPERFERTQVVQGSRRLLCFYFGGSEGGAGGSLQGTVIRGTPIGRRMGCGLKQSCWLGKPLGRSDPGENGNFPGTRDGTSGISRNGSASPAAVR